MPAGRPSLKTDAIMEEIAFRLSEGEPLKRICADNHMPHFSTVWRWEEEDEAFRDLSARARRFGTHALADECIAIADDDELEPNDRKVRIDTRLRLIGKWNAKAYGDRQTTELTGAGGGPVRVDVSGLSPEQLDAIASAKLEGE